MKMKWGRRYSAICSQVIDQFDIPAVSALFQETDFVGMSSYPSLGPHFTPDQLENALWQFAREIKYFGVDLGKVGACMWAGGLAEILTAL